MIKTLQLGNNGFLVSRTSSSFLLKLFSIISFSILVVNISAFAQRRMDKLGRGVVAIQATAGNVFVSWRLLATDPDGVGFNIYRSAAGGAEVKLNSTPLVQGTNYLNTGVDITKTNNYIVKPVINNIEQGISGSYMLPANATVKPYIGIPLKAIADGPYYVHHSWPGDLDGNGEYDIVADRLPEGTTPANRTIKLDGYLMDGTFKWQIDLGPNTVISDGHNDGVTVYDMDGDGKAEILVRTSEGTVFGNGAVIGDVNSDGKTDYRVSGVPTGQPQFISVVNGETGAEISRITCVGTGHFGIGYFDGVHPSLLFEREFKNASNVTEHHVTTFDYVNGGLTQRWDWVWDNVKYQFFHQIRIADIDNDGKDEFCEGGFVLDDDGSLLYSTELGHGDRFQISDFDPDRQGLETFAIQQDNPTFLATVLYDSKSGKMIKKNYLPYQTDIGRGDAGDIDPRYRGMEFWTPTGDLGTQSGSGTQIYNTKPSYANMAIWWDGDLLRETMNRQLIDKWNYTTNSLNRLLTAYNWGATYSWRDAGPLYGDFIGDWREEALLEKSDHTELQLFSTTIPSTNRIYCLMQNPAYRLCTTVRGYIQSNQVDYFLGDGMETPPKPPIFDGDLVWKGGAGNTVWDISNSTNWKNLADISSVFLNNKSVLFDLSGYNSSPITINTALSPSSVTINSPINYVFSGSGSLTGSMPLTKAGSGKLTINTVNDYLGNTTINEGSLVVDGKLTQSLVVVESRGILGGSGSVEKGIIVNSKGSISPGSGIGSAGVLAIKNGLTLNDRAQLLLDLTSDNTGLIKVNDKVQVEGDFQFSTNMKIIINPLEPLSGGVYNLVSYTGILNGNLNDVKVEGLDGVPYTLSSSSGNLILTIQSVRAPGSIVWSGLSNSDWDIAKTSNWTKDGNSAIFVANDDVIFNDTGVNTSVNITSVAPAASLTVNATKDYTFSGLGNLSGNQSLVKSGSGKLIMQTLNSYKGSTQISGGTLEVATLALGGENSALGASSTNTSNLVLNNGGALRVTSSLPVNTDRGLTLGTGGGKIDVSNALTSFNGLLTGSGSLTKIGTGILALGGKNTYSGGTTINEGTIQLSSFDANEFGLGSGIVNLSGGTLSMVDTYEGDYDYVNTTGPWNLNVPTGFTGRLNAAGRCVLTGALTGGGTFEFYTAFIRTQLNGNWSQFTGTIKVLTDTDGGDLRINTSTGYGKSTLNLGNNVNAYYLTTVSSSGTTLEAGAITGSASATLRGGSTSGRTLTWKIGGLNTDAVFNGTIAENGSSSILAINKVGTGTWTISGINTYKGQTTVSAGKLLVNNTSGSGTGTAAVSVANGATLGGTGSISGAVTLVSGGIIEPGNNGIGTFTLSGSLSIPAASKVLTEVNLNTSTNDLLSIGGTLTYGGTLFINNIGSNAYAIGNSFKLFNAAAYAGSFTAINPAKPATGLAWDTSQLLVNGTIKIIVDNSLPISLISFEALAEQNKVKLKWSTSSEYNNDHFEIERSVDGKTFTSIITTKGAGTNNNESHYIVYDNSPISGVNYYQLKQYDFDGTVKVHGIRSVKFGDFDNNKILFYPNPVKSSIYIGSNVFQENEFLQVSITALNGVKLFSGKGNVESVNKQLQGFIATLNKGIYILNLSSDKETYNSKFIKE